MQGGRKEREGRLAACRPKVPNKLLVHAKLTVAQLSQGKAAHIIHVVDAPQ
jgi:hypothetical protein